MTTRKLVLIEWLDSHSGSGWKTVEQLERVAMPLYCRSVGWLVAERKECKVIVPHIGGEKNGDAMLIGCGDLTIPTDAIIKTTVLRQK
jgi:hypothetical protein